MSDFTLDPDDAQEIVYDGHVAIVEVSQHRWYTKRLVVFEYEDEDIDGLYGFHYDDPATEDQEGQDRFEAEPRSRVQGQGPRDHHDPRL